MGERVLLHLATMEDVDFIVDIKSNPDLWHFEYDIVTDKGKVRETVTDRISGNWYRQYIIQLNNDERTPVGEFHIHIYDEERKSWEIGYCILPEYQRQGYCFEAAKMILKYAFEDFGAHRVIAMCNAFNEASYRVLEKLGMTKEGVFRQELPWDGKWADQLFYAMLDCEYSEQKVKHTAL